MNSAFLSPSIFNARHGVTEANILAKGRFDREDTLLLPEGHQQMYDTGMYAAPFGIGKVVCGPALRHRESAEDFVDGLGYRVPIEVDDDAREQQWSPQVMGLLKAEVFARPDVIRQALHYGLALNLYGSESEVQVAARMQRLYQRHFRPFSGSLVVVTSQQPAKSPQAVTQRLDRAKFCKIEVPQGSLAVYDPYDPGIRSTLFVPTQYKP